MIGDFIVYNCVWLKTNIIVKAAGLSWEASYLRVENVFYN